MKHFVHECSGCRLGEQFCFTLALTPALSLRLRCATARQAGERENLFPRLGENVASGFIGSRRESYGGKLAPALSLGEGTALDNFLKSVGRGAEVGRGLAKAAVNRTHSRRFALAKAAVLSGCRRKVKRQVPAAHADTVAARQCPPAQGLCRLMADQSPGDLF